jgi:hypothetical protein
VETIENMVQPIQKTEIMNRETIKEAAKAYLNSGKVHNAYASFIDGAAWQAERMYSEEEMERAFHEGVKSKATFLEWFDQNKKQKS